MKCCGKYASCRKDMTLEERLPEFKDVFKVLEFGETKYGPGDNWLEPNAVKMDHKSNHDSMFHHLAESFTHPLVLLEEVRRDPESQLDTLLHLACRSLMAYTRMKRGIVHEKD